MADVKDPAARRFALLSLSRIAGVAVAVGGLVLLGRTSDREQGVVGILLVLIGVLSSELAPRALSRRWRTADREGRPPGP